MIPVPAGNGDVYVAGNFTTYNDRPVGRVVRLKPNGTLDDRFNMIAIGPPSLGNLVTAIAAADNGSGDLYANEVYPNEDRGRIWKVHSTGALDPGFTLGDVTHVDPSRSNTPTEIFALTPVGDGSGRVYVGGFFTQYNRTPVPHLVRVNPNGSLDQTFRPPGTGEPVVPPSGVYKILPAKDGSGDLYLAHYGQVSPAAFGSQHLSRLNGDGTLDSAFAGPNVVAGGGEIHTIALVEDGSGDLFVTGRFFRFSGDPNPIGPGTDIGFARIDPTGTIDRTSPRPEAGTAEVFTKAQDGSGDWLAGYHASPQRQSTVSRFKIDGPQDPLFMRGLMTGPQVHVIMPAPDASGDVYVGGEFTTYNTIAVGNIVRLNRDGSLN
jgi:hypothetical protein